MPVLTVPPQEGPLTLSPPPPPRAALWLAVRAAWVRVGCQDPAGPVIAPTRGIAELRLQPTGSALAGCRYVTGPAAGAPAWESCQRGQVLECVSGQLLLLERRMLTTWCSSPQLLTGKGNLACAAEPCRHLPRRWPDSVSQQPCAGLLCVILPGLP